MKVFYRNMGSETESLDHIVLDIETLGTDRGAPIVQIGAVAFNVGESEECWDFFEIKIDLKSLVLVSGISFATLDWWFNNDAALIKEVFGSANVARLPIVDALTSFKNWLRFRAPSALWGNGASFDNEIMKASFMSYCADPEPWSFRIDRCFRTVKNMYKEQVPEPAFIGTKHNALDDAYHQARWLNQILLYKQSTDAAIEQLRTHVELNAPKITP